VGGWVGGWVGCGLWVVGCGLRACVYVCMYVNLVFFGCC
jgi:hypothetical protein